MTGRSPISLVHCLVFLILMPALPAGMPGCGRKAPPRLPDYQPPAPVADLQAMGQDGQIHLTWQVEHATQDQIGAFRVLRSMRPIDSPACETCPLIFQPLATLVVPRSANQPRAVAMQYDDAVSDGFVYTYKLSALDDNGGWINDSNTVHIQTPAPDATSDTTAGPTSPALPMPPQPNE